MTTYNEYGMLNAARIMTIATKYDRIQPVLWSLHWLAVPSMIRYTNLLFTFNCIHGTAPAYLCQHITSYQPAHFDQLTNFYSKKASHAPSDRQTVHSRTVHQSCGMNCHNQSDAPDPFICKSASITHILISQTLSLITRLPHVSLVDSCHIHSILIYTLGLF